MDRQEIRKRTRDLYADELQYAIARDDEVDTEAVREKAAARLARQLDERELYELCRGMVDAVSRSIERQFVVDLDTMQIGIGTALRTAANTLVPTARARRRDWLAFDALREQVFQDHAEKRTQERTAIRDIVARLDEYGNDPATFEACPDLFASAEVPVFA